MAAPVRMPQLGESITEGTVLRWLKGEGDLVALEEPLVEIETEKVTVEMPSPVAGRVTKILVPAGETVPVGAELCLIEEEAAVPAGAAPARAPAAEKAPPASVPPAVPAEAGSTEAAEHPAHRRRWLSPVVQRLAREHQVDLEQVRGTGIEGRVTRRDVMAYLARRAEGPATAVAASEAPEAAPVVGREEPQLVRPSATRRTIAQRLTRSAQTIPHAWMMVEADVTPLARYREEVKRSFRDREGVDLTFLPFVIKAAVESLKEYPHLNASWRDEGLLVYREVNVGIAVATEEGLIVPVIRKADGLSIAGLAHAVADLSGRARARKLRLAEVEGGTFTVNNTGAFGSVLSAPIINPPQVANLTSEQVVKRAVVQDGDAIAVRAVMNLCISFDHRAVDGAYVGAFMEAVKRRLEGYGPPTPLY